MKDVFTKIFIFAIFFTATAITCVAIISITYQVSVRYAIYFFKGLISESDFVKVVNLKHFSPFKSLWGWYLLQTAGKKGAVTPMMSQFHEKLLNIFMHPPSPECRKTPGIGGHQTILFAFSFYPNNSYFLSKGQEISFI